MQNDTLKNRIVPWQEKGRWYHAQLHSNGTLWEIDLSNSDELFADFDIYTNEYLRYQGALDIHIIDFKYDILDLPTGGLTLPTTNGMCFRVTPQFDSIQLITPSRYEGDLTLWLFAYFK